MVREELARRRVGGEDFRWRGEEVCRVEGFSDAVFAFAVCFALLLFLWYDHYKFFRRYGLRDSLIIHLNAALLSSCSSTYTP